MSEIAERGYARPEMLVSTAWVADHIHDPAVRLVESNEDPLLYHAGHIEGAVEVDWTRDLNHSLRRDYLDRAGFEALMRRIGADETTTIVFYGDRNNWWACYALWVFSLFGLTKLRIMDGGRFKWAKEGRPLVRQPSPWPRSAYVAPERDDHTHRIFRDEVLAHVHAGKSLVDVRTPEEYHGHRLHMPDYPNEGALRGGHIPGARNIPWMQALENADGVFKSADDLRALYIEEQNLDPAGEIVTYCRIGERSSHTWFVLTWLLGYRNVRNYDGSWTEWGNLVGAPIEK